MTTTPPPSSRLFTPRTPTTTCNSNYKPEPNRPKPHSNNGHPGPPPITPDDISLSQGLIEQKILALAQDFQGNGYLRYSQFQGLHKDVKGKLAEIMGFSLEDVNSEIQFKQAVKQYQLKEHHKNGAYLGSGMGLSEVADGLLGMKTLYSIIQHLSQTAIQSGRLTARHQRKET